MSWSYNDNHNTFLVQATALASLALEGQWINPLLPPPKEKNTSQLLGLFKFYMEIGPLEEFL